MINYLDRCVKAALAGGNSIRTLARGDAKVKSDAHVGHHAIVTPDDYTSQEAILQTLLSDDRDSFFITEENVPELLRNRMVGASNLRDIDSQGVYIIDELDGTSSKAGGHYEWSVSVGFVERLEHLAGAVYAPDIYGGALFYASRGNGAFMEAKEKIALNVSQKTLRDAYLIFGVDCFLTKYLVHNDLVHKLSDSARTTNSNGSCALSLGLVAAGRADALVQPLQSPWDWAAGKLLVEEAGGRMIFYEMKDNRIIPVEKLEAKHYNPVRREVGFIAANPNLAENIMQVLMDLQRNGA